MEMRRRFWLASRRSARASRTINSESGTFNVVKTGILTGGQHVLVMEYLGNGLDGYLPVGSITVTFTEAAIGAKNNSLASTDELKLKNAHR